MISISAWLRVAVFSTLLFSVPEDSFPRPRSLRPAKPAPCATPEYRQFDFWLGDWDAYDFDHPNSTVARNRVDLILDGCVLREDYQQGDGLHGQSFSIYDASRKVWHQSWVTSRGQLLTMEGKLKNAEMVLSGMNQSALPPKLVRGVWKPVPDGVRETAVTSSDGGKTWQPWFDMLFRHHDASPLVPAAILSGDQRSVAALDTQYQAAVKNNDADTMGRLLADDFVLVVGSGKTYTKTDLLAEARSGRVQYVHQEDTDQTVRVWGDTAVITAKLWEKGTDNGKPFDYTVWFSDTYVRTPSGWRYVFGQSSLPLPKTP